MAILIYPDGKESTKLPEMGRCFTADDKRRLVPGNDELIFVSDKAALLIDSRARAHGQPYNESASRLLRRLTGATRDLFGNVLWLDFAEMTESEPKGCPEIRAAYDLERVDVARRRMRDLQCLKV